MMNRLNQLAAAGRRADVVDRALIAQIVSALDDLADAVTPTSHGHDDAAALYDFLRFMGKDVP